jgi:hypothetical protein
VRKSEIECKLQVLNEEIRIWEDVGVVHFLFEQSTQTSCEDIAWNYFLEQNVANEYPGMELRIVCNLVSFDKHWYNQPRYCEAQTGHDIDTSNIVNNRRWQEGLSHLRYVYMGELYQAERNLLLH